MPLDSKAVDRIFARMTVRYGSAWLGKWQGVPMDAVHADWALELDGVRYQAIAYALGYLPTDFPPTAAQFRAICLRAPEPAVPRLEAPRADPVRVASIVDAIIVRPAESSPRAWAYRLRNREARGEVLSKAQRDMWRAALHVETARVVLDAVRDGADVSRELVTAALVGTGDASAREAAEIAA